MKATYFPGDEVILPPLSWVASLNAVILCGATPVFVDITEDLNINAELIPEAITPNTKAILPIHFTGKLCDIKKINAIAEQHGLLVVEDAAQSFGAELDGKKAGSFGTLGCLSMNPMKLLCAYGDAGAIVTNDDGFRIRDNADNTKQLAFECSGISGSTTRTLTAPNDSGTISTESFATAIAVALG